MAFFIGFIYKTPFFLISMDCPYPIAAVLVFPSQLTLRPKNSAM